MTKTEDEIAAVRELDRLYEVARRTNRDADWARYLNAVHDTERRLRMEISPSVDGHRGIDVRGTIRGSTGVSRSPESPPDPSS